ncbi:cryptochrome/photolyase family protein [Ideonella sp.]|uniref:cryptochrome/photolyase family protein n=1 Tax=Ideonella sp. TaxID=1929293 RepID=UPI003BB76508
MEKLHKRALVWFRRDLRADDNAALSQALRSAAQVFCVFVFDQDILAPLPRVDRRVEFIRESLVDLNAQLDRLARAQGVQGARLLVMHGQAQDCITRCALALQVDAVYANHDDEPAALTRDTGIATALRAADIELHTFKDHVVFERSEVMTATGGPYSVFTPYKNAWLKKLQHQHLAPWPVADQAAALAPLPPEAALRLSPDTTPNNPVPELATLGFEASNLQSLRMPIGSTGAAQLLDDFLERIDRYEESRNFPAVKGPSYLSTHLRFGTVSIRRLAREAWQRMQGGSHGAEVWLSELIWRDFYHQVLFHHPRVVGHCFKPEYDAVRWAEGPDADALYAAWCEGRTGYPLVDAAMLQLLATGYMHNRLRMVSACFLVKDLGIDWRRGEAWFERHLNDFDLAANNGGWQWAASTGCDAQPYFRIFNPVTQSEKFDPEGKFIKRYLPCLAVLGKKSIHAPWLAKPIELAAADFKLGVDYPWPVVAHDEARGQTLARFAKARAEG